METARINILAIDDHPDNLITLKAVVGDALPDAVVFTAPNGAEGIALALREAIDVVLLDIVMPDMDGFEVCRRMKAEDRLNHIPIVFLTALKTDRENRIRALEVGAEGFLSKPIDEMELTAQIRAMVKIKTAAERERGETKRLADMLDEYTSELRQSQTDAMKLLTELQEENEMRRQTELELLESEGKYRAVIDQASDCVALIDPETGEILEGNIRFSELLGYCLPEDAPLYVTGLVLDDPQNVGRLLRQAREEGCVQTQRRVFRHRNGTHVPVARTGAMIRYRGKQIYTATFHDISDDLRREQEILRDAAAAQRIQEALLAAPRSTEHIRIAAFSKAHLYVGGDLYFLDWRFGGRLLRGFLVDTMGHGLGTALHAAAFHVMLREVNETDRPLVEQMRELNRRALRHFDDDTFAAVVGFEVDLENRELRWAAAGIPEFWISSDLVRGRVTTPGLYLGIRAEEIFESRTLPLQEKDCIYFCTDGLSERIREDLPLDSCPEMEQQLRNLMNEPDCRDDATAICISIVSFPEASGRQDGWPQILHLDGFASYQRRKNEIARCIEAVTGLEHSKQEVAVNEAVANALECRDAVARDHRARVKFSRRGNRFIVRVRTSRMGFAGNAVLARLRSDPESAFAFGGEAMMGRGIPLMFCLADCMTYNEEGTEVLLAWRLPK